ncbi:MAG: DUF1016 domain-containing protein [Firmicutes bacterium]|nr:DUF1016 domain-containing protein [Bacillota bacterium]
MDYFKEIEQFIIRNEVNKKSRRIEENNDILFNYWNIGKLIMKAQGGEARAKYGNKLIKEWSLEYTEKYGKGYDYTNLSRARQLYLAFPILGPVAQLSWTTISKLLPIKDVNKRNYYINLCLENNLSKRELIKEIKNNSYERLLVKKDEIKINNPNKKYKLIENIKNPIIIELTENERIKTEKDLEIMILSKLKSIFKQLGEGFAFIDNQYKITYNKRNYYIDILLFNIKLNCYVVVELKTRELKKEDKSQIEFYMNIINEKIKEIFHNKTIGIIISKEQDKFIANFVSDESIIPITYIIKS